MLKCLPRVDFMHRLYAINFLFSYCDCDFLFISKYVNSRNLCTNNKYWFYNMFFLICYARKYCGNFG